MEQQNQETKISNVPEGDSEITETDAVIIIEGQEFELEASLARDDKLLRTILQPHFSAVENASITRELKNGKLHVRLVKRAQHKGC